MMTITINGNRLMLAFVLIYFPIATVGSTGSLWSGLKQFGFLLAVIGFGYAEGKLRPTQEASKEPT